MSDATLADRPETEGELPPPLIDGERLDRATFHTRYRAMPPGFRAELIAGRVLVSSPVHLPHAEFHGDLMGWLWTYRATTPGVRLGDNGTVLIDDENELQPDAFLFLPPEAGGRVRVEGAYVAGAPELVMEVSDSTARVDLKSKRLEYESAGVREYLVVDLSARRVHWFELAGEFFRPLEPDEDGIVRSRVFPGLWLDATALLDRRVDRVLAALREGLATPEHAEFAARLSG